MPGMIIEIYNLLLWTSPKKEIRIGKISGLAFIFELKLNGVGPVYNKTLCKNHFIKNKQK